MEVLATAPGGEGLPMDRARWRALLEDDVGALESIRAAREQRDVWYFLAAYFPELAPLRGDPRFQALLPGS